MFGVCLSTANQADSSLCHCSGTYDICLQYKPAVTNHQDVAAVLETPCLVSASVLQTRLTAAFCHCSGTY